MRTLLIHAWTIHQKNNKFYLLYTHWVYLKEIVKYYDRICLLSPIRVYDNNGDVNELVCLDQISELKIYSLPYHKGYMSALKHFFYYKTAYSKLADYTDVYIRYPIPLGWLSKLYLRKSKRIIHFVGDPVDTIKVNPNIGIAKKLLLTNFFLPEYWLYLWACKGACVFTNGYHIAEKLKQHGIEAKAIISSTLCESDFYFDEHKQIALSPSIIYIGYLRKAKGVDVVIQSFAKLRLKYPHAKLTIVGSGDSENKLKQMVREKGIFNIVFTGHIDDRKRLNDLLRTHDIFCFASLSEGSPRVILEAMANGINVVTSPVGTLPHVFVDEGDIMFADFNNIEMFCDKMIDLIENQAEAQRIRKNAFNKIQNYTVEKFLREIFYET